MNSESRDLVGEVLQRGVPAAYGQIADAHARRYVAPEGNDPSTEAAAVAGTDALEPSEVAATGEASEPAEPRGSRTGRFVRACVQITINNLTTP